MLNAPVSGGREMSYSKPKPSSCLRELWKNCFQQSNRQTRYRKGLEKGSQGVKKVEILMSLSDRLACRYLLRDLRANAWRGAGRLWIVHFGRMINLGGCTGPLILDADGRQLGH